MGASKSGQKLLERYGMPEIIGAPDDTWGEMVAAAAVLEIGESLDIDTLRAWCRDRLSTYKIPEQLLALESLPRNAMGKVTKPAIRDLF